MSAQEDRREKINQLEGGTKIKTCARGILEILSKVGGKAYPWTIESSLKSSREYTDETIRRSLNFLINHGMIERKETGVYFLVEY